MSDYIEKLRELPLDERVDLIVNQLLSVVGTPQAGLGVILPYIQQFDFEGDHDSVDSVECRAVAVRLQELCNG